MLWPSSSLCTLGGGGSESLVPVQRSGQMAVHGTSKLLPTYLDIRQTRSDKKSSQFLSVLFGIFIEVQRMSACV
jgi:hypothetical protein